MTSLKARLTKAKARLFGTAAKDIVVPFEIPCDCGHRVTGIRRSSYQIATCSSCDASNYVLPVNVYPATKRVRSEVLDGPVASRLGTIVQELITGEPEAIAKKQPTAVPDRRRAARTAPAGEDTSLEVEKPKGKNRRSGTQRSGTQPKLSPAAAAIVADPILIEEPIVRIPRPGITVILRRTFTPFRLLMISAVILVATTGWWVVAQRRLDEARKVWRREMDVAESALEKEDLATLEKSLMKAVEAAETLRRDDADSRRAVSLLQQTLAVQNLSAVDMISVLTGNLTVGGQPSPTKAAAAAESLRGKWFVFDCRLVTSGQELRADIPLSVDSVPVVISIESDRLQRAVTAMPQSPLLFVASIESSEMNGAGSEFQIHLQGHSWSLITTEFHAAQLGFTTLNMPGLDALIRRQAEFLNSSAASTQIDTVGIQVRSQDVESIP